MPECPEQWKIDVNDKYQQAVGVVISLSTASMILPILFLKDVVGATHSITYFLNTWAYAGWVCLAASVLTAICYYYTSAKWVKLAWRQETKMFRWHVEHDFVEAVLDRTYFVMVGGFIAGLALMVIFMARFNEADVRQNPATSALLPGPVLAWTRESGTPCAPQIHVVRRRKCRTTNAPNAEAVWLARAESAAARSMGAS